MGRGRAYSDFVRDENPIIVGLAISEIAKNWNTDHLTVLLGALTNDDSSNRWGAFVTLQKNAGPRFDRIVDELLADSDLRKRGLAAYAIVEREGEQKFDVLEKMLLDPAELVRFDAVSALVIRGGVKGKKILSKHLRIEKQPRLKALIDQALKSIPK